MRHFRSLALAALLPLLSGGCYSYQTVRVEEVAPGASIRARLTAAEVERIQADLGRESRVVEGQVVHDEGSSFVLAVATRVAADGLGARRFETRLRLTKPEITEIEVRRLNRGRTAALVALGGAVAAFVVSAAFDYGGIGAPGDGGKGGEAILIPIGLFRP